MSSRMIPFIENDSRLDDRVKRISAARRLLAGEGLLRVTHDVTRSDLAVATTQLIGVTAIVCQPKRHRARFADNSNIAQRKILQFL